MKMKDCCIFCVINPTVTLVPEAAAHESTLPAALKESPTVDTSMLIQLPRASEFSSPISWIRKKRITTNITHSLTVDH